MGNTFALLAIAAIGVREAQPTSTDLQRCVKTSTLEATRKEHGYCHTTVRALYGARCAYTGGLVLLCDKKTGSCSLHEEVKNTRNIHRPLMCYDEHCV